MAHFLKSMANATQILTLAASALGLGSQWVSINRLVETPLKVLLDIPDKLTIHTLVLVGYPFPGFKPKTPYRRDVKEIMHLEKYDRSASPGRSQPLRKWGVDKKQDNILHFRGTKEISS